MEHPGCVTGLTPGVTAWTAETIASLPPGERQTMAALVDEAGARSARAQALPTAITSTDRLTRDQIVYLCCDTLTNPKRGPTIVLGILKTGDKNLFINRGGSRGLLEMEPRCVLDFYVHETAQRKGIGGLLFDFCLRDENKNPARLAYDRPSEKFLKFLAKHHGLVKHQPQTNNFVVFDAYFEVKPRPASAAKEAKKLLEGRGVGLAAAARAKAAAARAAREEAERDAKRRQETSRQARLSSSSSRFEGHGAASERASEASRRDDESNSARDEERFEGRRLLPPSSGAPFDVGPRSSSRDGIPSSSGQSRDQSRTRGIASSFSSRFARPGRRFAERRDTGTAASRDADAEKKGAFFSTNDASRDASRRSSPRDSGSGTFSSGDPYHANANDDARGEARLSPKPPRHFPKPPRRATPPEVESDDATTTNDVFRDASSVRGASGGSRRSTSSFTTSSSRDEKKGSFPSSSSLKTESSESSERRKPPPSLRGTSYASFVRGVREMGREKNENENATAIAARTSDDPDVTRTKGPIATARGEYGQWVAPREGYYRARSFVKTRSAPAYQNSRRRDQTTDAFADSQTDNARFPETRFGMPSEKQKHSTSVHSYGAQQDLFLRRRAAFERAEAVARGDKRFGDFRILPEKDESNRESDRFRVNRASGSSGSRLRRLAPLYGDGRYGADAVTHCARLAPSAEPELVRVGRRAMGENF